MKKVAEFDTPKDEPVSKLLNDLVIPVYELKIEQTKGLFSSSVQKQVTKIMSRISISECSKVIRPEKLVDLLSKHTKQFKDIIKIIEEYSIITSIKEITYKSKKCLKIEYDTRLSLVCSFVYSIEDNCMISDKVIARK